MKLEDRTRIFYNLVSKLNYKFLNDVLAECKGNYEKSLDKVIRKIERDVVEELTRESKNPPIWLIEFLESMSEKIINHLLNKKYRYRFLKVVVKTLSPLTVDRSGGVGVPLFEIGLSLHPIFGIPYIPASTLKGGFRSALYEGIKLILDSEEKANILEKYIFGDGVATACEEFKDFFLGTDNFKIEVPKSISSIIFLDAFPTKDNKGPLIIPDVLTPHYTSNVATELDVRPTPILHLVVPKNVVFSLTIGYDNVKIAKVVKYLSNWGYVEPDFSNFRLMGSLNSQEKFLIDVLQLAGFIGIGAKTAVGYSRFEIISVESYRGDNS